jgi:Secretion system C-terminal sorting domain
LSNSIKTIFILTAFLSFSTFVSNGQETLLPIRFRPELNVRHDGKKSENKTTALSLPFFEDFSGYSPFPDSNKWTDMHVYINNTMSVSPPSRGVATFDALNELGMPYDTLATGDNSYADSLTSRPIDLDLSVTVPGDSLYLSFFFQPQGNGFYPLPQDSLMLYFKNKYGTFVKIWSVPGTSLQPFQQVMLPITDSFYFHSSFQFRFVNIAGLNGADANWNLDYIRLNKNRFAADTAVTDIAFTADPSFLLNDYTFMPYNQFIANTTGETASYVWDSINNNNLTSQTINTNLSLTDVTAGSSTPLTAAISGISVLPGGSIQNITETIIIPSFPSYATGTRVDFEIKYYLQSTAATGPLSNDTIVKEQIFDNCLAYDDGSAEQAYYLNLNPSGAIPGEIQIEFHLNTPDTLRGLAIYFSRQVPLPWHKEFFINIYSTLAGVSGYYTDNLLRQQQMVFPGYADTINHFWIYRLDTPIVLPAGTFYAGIMQPAYSGSDSLYLGYDVNRLGANHAYYRVTGTGQPWNPSLFNGAIMMRALVGRDIRPSYTASIKAIDNVLTLFPNPASDKILVSTGADNTYSYYITNTFGNLVQKGTSSTSTSIDIAQLPDGAYFINMVDPYFNKSSAKFLKISTSK